MTVTTQYAQEHLPELLDSVERGQEIEIAREGKPNAKLFIVPTPAATPKRGERRLGMGRGIYLPEVDAQWQQMKDEDEAYFASHNVLSTGEV